MPLWTQQIRSRMSHKLANISGVLLKMWFKTEVLHFWKINITPRKKSYLVLLVKQVSTLFWYLQPIYAFIESLYVPLKVIGLVLQWYQYISTFINGMFNYVDSLQGFALPLTFPALSITINLKKSFWKHYFSLFSVFSFFCQMPTFLGKSLCGSGLLVFGMRQIIQTTPSTKLTFPALIFAIFLDNFPFLTNDLIVS